MLTRKEKIMTLVQWEITQREADLFVAHSHRGFESLKAAIDKIQYDDFEHKTERIRAYLRGYFDAIVPILRGS